MTVIQLAEKLAAPPRLLVVDDDEAIRRLVEHSLQKLGCEPVAVGDGDQAIQRLAQESFAGVILDLRLPGKSGYDVLKWLRENGLCVPVVVITGYPDEDAYRLVELYGVLAVLVKPFTPETLITTLRRYFNIFKLRICEEQRCHAMGA